MASTFDFLEVAKGLCINSGQLYIVDLKTFTQFLTKVQKGNFTEDINQLTGTESLPNDLKLNLSKKTADFISESRHSPQILTNTGFLQTNNQNVDEIHGNGAWRLCYSPCLLILSPKYAERKAG